MARWSARTRSYHGVGHLEDCLDELDGVLADAVVADRAEFAIWYHDAVYCFRARDNEERSAQLLLEDAPKLALPRDCAQAAAALVRATALRPPPNAFREPGADLVVDVDRSILGRKAPRFWDYEVGIEEEYSPAVWPAFALARGRFLASLLALPSIYRTEHFRRQYEDAARRNISALLSSPRYRAYRWLRWLPLR